MTPKTTRLKYLCVDGGQYGLNVPAADYVPEGEGLRLIRTTDLRPDGLLPPDEGIYAPTPVDPRFLLGQGDVLVSRAGTIGRSFLTPPAAAGSTFAGFLVRFRPRPDTDSRYLNYVLQSTPVQQQIQAEAITSTIQNFNAERYANLDVPSAGLPEQRRIADYLDDQVALLERTIALRQQQIDLTRELNVAQIDNLLRQGGRPAVELLPAEYQPFGVVPRSWKQGRLRSTSVEVQTGPFGSQLNADEYVDGAWPVVNPSNITREGCLIRDDTVTVNDGTRARLARHVLQVGDVVFGRRGDLGRAGLVTEEHAGWVCGTGSLRVRFLEAAFDPAYLTRFLRLPSIRHYFESNSVGSTMQNLNTSLLLGMPLLIPALDEQRSIAERADALAARSEGLVRLLTQSIDLVRERKRALITAAVTGKIDVSTARPVEVA